MGKKLFLLLFSVCFALAWTAAVSPSPAYALGFHASSYWCDNTNYPMVRSHMGYDQYDDLSSAYIADQWSDEYTDYKVCICNIIVVQRDTNEITDTHAARILIGNGEDGPSFYKPSGVNWEELNDYGYNEAYYNTGWILLHYFNGEPI